MGKSKIDPIIQRKLYNLATPLDKGALWAALEGEIIQPPKKNNKFVAFWLFGGLLCAAIGLYGYTLVNQSSSYVTQLSQFNNTPEPIDGKALPLSEGMEDKNNQEHEVKIDDKSLNIENETKVILEPIKNTLKKKPRLRRSEKTKVAKEVREDLPMPIINQTIIDKTTLNKPGIVSTTAIKARSPILKQDVQKIKTTESIKETISKLPNYKLAFLSQDKSELALNMTPSKIKKVDCYDYNYTYSPISIIGYYGPGLSKRWLSNNQQGTEADFHFDLRDNNESTLEGHRAGALIKFKVKSGFFVKAGLEVANINEKLEYETSVTEPITIENTIIRYDVLPDGTEVPVYGDIEGFIERNKTWLIYNQYRFVDIPVLLGYEMRLNRWNVAAEAGVLINQSMQFTDGASSESGSTFGMISGEPETNIDYYKANTGIALQLGAGLGFSVSKKITLWATPSLRHGLGSIGHDSYVLDQNYTSVNLLFGAELKF